nr:helix-hairpin-helix domain-containing protein [uncultured Ligilactobacillus sp.]
MENIKFIWEEHKNKIIIGLLIVGIVCCLFMPSYKQSDLDESKFNFSSTIESNTTSSTVTEQSVSNSDLYVDIKGAVNHPGAYKMDPNQRVGDVIQKAGGLSKNSDCNRVNLAQKLTDQMVIYVPIKGETIPISNDVSLNSSIQDQSNNSNASNETNKIKLNTATLEQLKQLNGVGEKKAQKILDYRQQHGGFKAIDALKNVDGIGEKSCQNLASQVCV